MGLRGLEGRLVRARERRRRRKIVIFGGEAAERRSDVTVLPWSHVQETAWL